MTSVAFPKTDIYVGRHATVESIAGVFQHARAGTCQALYVESGGGLGKTYLLQQLPSLLRDRLGDDRMVLARIIDLSDSEARRGSTIEAYLIDGLKNPRGQWYRFAAGEVDAAFAPYYALRSAYDQQRTQVTQGAAQQYRVRLRQQFIECFNALAQRRPIVIRFDTTEALYSAPVENEILSEAFPTSAGLFYEWLEGVLPKLRHTLVLLAGRPLPSGRPIEEALGRLGLLALPRLTLTPFDAGDVREYLRAYGQPEPSEVELQTIMRRTEGLPLLLTCLVETRTGAFPLPAATDEQATRTEFQTYLLEQILTPFASHRTEPQRMLGYCLYVLSYARRGMTRQQLADYLTTYGYAGILADEHAPAQLEALLANLERVALVKVRPDTNVLFLHDEIYAMLDELTRQDPLAMRIEVVAYLVERARARLAAASNRIEQFNATRDLIYYLLTRDVEDGYREYLNTTYRLFYELRDPDNALTLRDELWRWLNVPANRANLDESRLNFAEVQRDDAVWLVKYYVARGEQSDAVRVGRLVRTRMLREPAQDDFFTLDLLIALAKALTLQGGAGLPEALTLYEEALALLDQETINQRYLRDRRDFFRGEVLTLAGYLIRLQHDYARATDYAERAREAYSRYAASGATDFNIRELLAQATNNLVFLDNLQGNHTRAELLADQLLEQFFPDLTPERQALVQNVRSIVHLNTAGGLADARTSAEQARAIAADLNNPRIRGLVAFQYGAVLHEEMKQRKVFTEEARPFFVEAEELLASEQANLAETLLAHGKYERNLAYWLQRNGDTTGAEHGFAAALVCFERALDKVAQEPSVTRAELLVNKAVIERFRNDLPAAERLLAEARETMCAVEMPAYVQIVAGTVAFEQAQIALLRNDLPEALTRFLEALGRAQVFSLQNRTIGVFQRLTRDLLRELPVTAVRELVALSNSLLPQALADAGELQYQVPEPPAWVEARSQALNYLRLVIDAVAAMQNLQRPAR